MISLKSTHKAILPWLFVESFKSDFLNLIIEIIVPNMIKAPPKSSELLGVLSIKSQAKTKANAGEIPTTSDDILASTYRAEFIKAMRPIKGPRKAAHSTKPTNVQLHWDVSGHES